MKLILSSLILCTGLFSSVFAVAECKTDLTKPNKLYTDNKDGTVTVIASKLMWQKCTLGMSYKEGSCADNASTLNWGASVAAAKTANTDKQYSKDDWRLPTIKELESLVDTACVNTSINQTLFPNTVNSIYWSSTEAYKGYPSYVEFNGGTTAYVKGSDNKRFVRLVRSGS